MRTKLTILCMLALLALATCRPAPQSAPPTATPTLAPYVVDWGMYDNPGPRERIGINTRTDSEIYNGADLTFYSDDHVTQKLKLYGDSGNIATVGDISADDITASGTGSFSDIELSGLGITIDGMVFTYTQPITISGVISNVRLLYYQIP